MLVSVGSLQSQSKLNTDSLNFHLERKEDYFSKFLNRDSGILKLYADRYNLKYVQKDGHLNSDDKYLLYNLSPTGHPIFIMPHETRSGRVVKADLVYPLGTSGLRLTGKGMTMGVFDGGRIQLEHQEFQGRVRMIDNVTLNNFHATHVTGIIAAGGINPDSRGIAYEASVDGYTFDNFDSKLIDALEDGLEISNHSYGPATGWVSDPSFRHSWRWYGDSTLSETVDYKFGYYSDWAQFHDALIYFYPYHILVTSAGNSRSQNGPSAPFTHEVLNSGDWVTSTKRRDPNGPYDSTPFAGVAKNIITVGAISGSSPDNFSMANFSSWGPTDDGRIKPDLVGVGVGVFSTLEDSGEQTNRYGNLQGTSMSSPNVAGGLLLIRQHFLQNLRYTPLASTIKGLGIHTAKQNPDAGRGPNYRFGWGLLDVEAAVNQITKLDSNKFVIEEFIIKDRQVLDKFVYSDGLNPLKVTLAWTDPEGDIPPPSLNPKDTILVNDIDLKVIDPEGNEFFPYILDPANPSNSATTGINYLDNTEVVEIENPIPGKYILEISHKKDSLVYGLQILSLIATGGDLKSDFNNLYWIGGSGDWGKPENWSDSPNGESVNRIPNKNDIVRFDNTSFSENAQIIEIGEDAECLNFIYNSDSLAIFDFTDANLDVNGSIYLSKKLDIIGEGQIQLTGEKLKFNGVATGGNDLRGIELIIDSNDALFEIEDSLIVDKITLSRGLLDLSHKYIQVNEFATIGEQSTAIDLRNSTLEIGNSFILSDSTQIVLTENSSIVFRSELQNTSYSLSASKVEFDKLIIKNGILIIDGESTFRSIDNSGTLHIQNSILVESMILEGGSNLVLSSGVNLALDTIEIDATINNVVSISGSQDGTSSLTIEENIKYCFDFLAVSNVLNLGQATLNAGPNGTLSGNTKDWFAEECENVLFADFTFENPCVDGITRFVNSSTGNPSEVIWTVSTTDGEILETQNLNNMEIAFDITGDYLVTLVIKKDELVKSYTNRVEIIENPLTNLSIFEDGNFLAATLSGLSFQWFLDGQPIDGATDRLFEPTVNGDYQVSGFNGKCNFLSPVFTVLNEVVGIEDDFTKQGVLLYPNPVENSLNIKFSSSHFLGEVSINLVGISGNLLLTDKLNLTSQNTETQISFAQVPTGIYILIIEQGDKKMRTRIIKD